MSFVKRPNVAFSFKQFHIEDTHSGMKVSTDGVLLGAWAPLSHALSILDIGAGSGLLSLMAAQRTDAAAKVVAIELDANAINNCADNIANSPWPNKITLVNQRIQDYAAKVSEQGIVFEHIICNPPYFTNGIQTQDSARANARHTNTLEFDELISCIAKLLSPQGMASLIIPSESLSELTFAISQSQLAIQQQVFVKSVPHKTANRVLLNLALSKHKTDSTAKDCAATEYGEILIRDQQGKYSDQMANLCQDFYIKL